MNLACTCRRAPGRGGRQLPRLIATSIDIIVILAIVNMVLPIVIYFAFVLISPNWLYYLWRL